VTDSQRVVRPIKWRNCCVMKGNLRLINGKELYDVGADLGQKTDVAAEHPELVHELRSRYEKWWDEMEPAHHGLAEIVVGNSAENPTMLTCHDWLSDENLADMTLTWTQQAYPPWNQQQIRSGLRYSGGYWAVQVERSGNYEFELRRWPREANQPLRASLAPGGAGPGEPSFREHTGVAMDIRGAVLKINCDSMRFRLKDNCASAITFKRKLRKGSHRLEAQFLDGDGRTFGAYYLMVTRK
jgi:hypothetical protein